MKTTAEHEWTRFESFCAGFRLSPSVDAAPLYLTWLIDRDTDARAIRRTIQALNSAARARGEQAWPEDERVSQWLRGFHKTHPYGRTGERADPLYKEHVLALAEACLTPTRGQRHQVAAVILAAATGLPGSALAQLTWTDVRFRANRVEITPPEFDRGGARSNGPINLDAVGGSNCPVQSLRGLREPGVSPYVFGGKGGTTNDRARLSGYLSVLPVHRGGYWPRKRLTSSHLARIVADLGRPGPQASRDLALITTSHGAALRGYEAIDLRQEDIVVHGQHLQVFVRDRREPIRIPAQPGDPACPVEAWRTWHLHLKTQTRLGPGQRAFLRVSGSRIWDRPMIPEGLAYVTTQRVEQAQLTGRYAFTSLRIGAIRGWIRDGRGDLLVARDAGLLSLSAVERHGRRENLLTHSIAGRVGL